MANRAHVEWNGEQLLARMREAARAAIDDVTAEAAADASVSHFWVNRTGMLESRIVTEDATVAGAHVTGRFGTTRTLGFYGLFHEEGTVHEFARPFLRPAGDRAFPTLAARIKEHLA
jgi:hypothetical protein